MHNTMRKTFEGILKMYPIPCRGSVLDVGSYNVNGSFRDYFPDAEKYVGIDVRDGPGVDIVSDNPRRIPVLDESFDVVVSGSCLEHTIDPRALVQEMGRAVKAGGYVYLSAPFAWHIHDHPADYWRFTPECFTMLLTEAGLHVLNAYLIERTPRNIDCNALAVKDVCALP